MRCISIIPKRVVTGPLSRVLLALMCGLWGLGDARAATVEVISPTGLRAWLIEDHQAPVLTLGFRFAGGSAEDPEAKEGLAHAAAEMFFQSGGELDADAYLQRWSEIGAEFDIEARMQSLRGTVRVLTSDRAKAMDLLSLALNAPRFDASSLDQIRDQIGAEIDRDADDPEAFAYLAYDRLGYGSHPRARPVAGTRQSIARLSAADLATYRQRVMARDGLSLAAIGDITPDELGRLLDRVFAGLPAHGATTHIAAPAPTVAKRQNLTMASSQAEVVFGLSLPGLSEHEQLAAELINYTLGGSAFTSRLYREVREKRGLAYSIGTTFDCYSFMTEVSGSFGSAPETVEQAIGIVRQEFQGLAAHPPTDAEIEEAKVALAGQYLRGLIRQADMANELTLRMGQGKPMNYIQTYAKQLADVSPGDVRALAKRIPWLERLVIVTIGGPNALGTPLGDKSQLHQPQAKEP